MVRLLARAPCRSHHALRATLRGLMRTVLALLVLPSLALATPFTVALDPGHGGSHDGALAPDGTKEKDVALAVAREVQELLAQDPEVRVLLTRDDDVDVALHDRTTRANEAKADLFVSIHCNSMPTAKTRKNTHGVETFFLSADASDAEARALAERENADVAHADAGGALDPVSLILQDLSRSQAHADASLLAGHVHRSLVKGIAAKDRGVRQAPFIVLLGAEMPAVLVEIGFISHPDEGNRLTRPAHRRKVAQAIVAGVREFRTKVHERRAAGHGPTTPAIAPSP